MTEDDEGLLECLASSGRSSVETIAADDRVALDREQVATRLDLLSETPFVDQFGLQSYQITHPGREVLDGSFDASTHPDPEH